MIILQRSIYILLLLILSSCATNSKIVRYVHDDMTLCQFNWLANDEGYGRHRYTEYNGFKLVGWNKRLAMPFYAIFDKNDMLVKYLGYINEFIEDEEVNGERAKKYLANFIKGYIKQERGAGSESVIHRADIYKVPCAEDNKTISVDHAEEGNIIGLNVSRALFTKELNEKDEPLGNINQISSHEGQVYLYISWFNLPQKVHISKVEIYDGNSNFVDARVVVFEPSDMFWNTWFKYNFIKMDHPGMWNFKVYLDDKLVIEKQLEVTNTL